MQENNGNPNPVLADYAKDIFIGLRFFNKKAILKNDHVFFPFCLFILFH